MSGDHLESKLLLQIDKSFLAVFLILSIFWGLHLFSWDVLIGELVFWMLYSSMSDYLHGVFHALSCHIEIAYGLLFKMLRSHLFQALPPPQRFKIEAVVGSKQQFLKLYLSLLSFILSFILWYCHLSAIELWMVSFIINVNIRADIKGEFCWPIKCLIG